MLASSWDVAIKPDETAERPLPDHLLVDPNGFTVDQRRLKTELGLVVAARRALEHFAGGRSVAPDRRMCERIERILEKSFIVAGCRPNRPDCGMTDFIQLIEHGVLPPCTFVRIGRSVPNS